jgi:hypothetical protein
MLPARQGRSSRCDAMRAGATDSGPVYGKASNPSLNPVMESGMPMPSSGVWKMIESGLPFFICSINLSSMTTSATQPVGGDRHGHQQGGVHGRRREGPQGGRHYFAAGGSALTPKEDAFGLICRL